MNDIDFLPADYLFVQTARTNNNWLRGLFVAVLALMAVGWGTQQKSLNDLRARHTRMQENAASMMSSVNIGDQVRVDLQRAENSVRMLDGLRTQMPPTRWLAAVVGALPARVSLIEIHAEIEDSVDPAARPETTAAAAAAAKSTESPVDPVKQDLDRLTKITPRRSLSISLRGSATDDLEVSQFLTALHRIDLFERVQLLFTDQQGQGNHSLRSFAIRLRTKSLIGRGSSRSAEQPVASASNNERK